MVVPETVPYGKKPKPYEFAPGIFGVALRENADWVYITRIKGWRNSMDEYLARLDSGCVFSLKPNKCLHQMLLSKDWAPVIDIEDTTDCEFGYFLKYIHGNALGDYTYFNRFATPLKKLGKDTLDALEGILMIPKDENLLEGKSLSKQFYRELLSAIAPGLVWEG